MKKIIVPICNRTNYSKLRSILKKLNQNKDIDLQIVVSSSLTLNTIPTGLNDIVDDGFYKIIKIDCLLANDTLNSMLKTCGLSLIEHSSVFQDIKPDAMLVVGDRYDILPSVLTARFMNIPILHIQGGEQSGSIDDTIRNMITMCSERHYVATDKAKERVERMTGSNFVYNFGCPAVEEISKINVGEYLDVKTFKKKYKNSFGIAPNENYILVEAHPNTNNSKDIDMKELLSAILSFGMKCVVLYPNIDAFNSSILDAIKVNYKNIISVRHMPLEDFIKLLAHSSCFIGNSSSIIRESGLFGVPSINIGDRQISRERNKNTIDCICDYDEITKAIKKSLEIGRYKKENIYYKENCVENIYNNIVEALNV